MLSLEATAQVVALRSSAEERSRFSSLLLNQSLAEVYHNSWTIAVYWCLLMSIDVYWQVGIENQHTVSAFCRSLGLWYFDKFDKWHFQTSWTPWGLRTWGFLQSLDTIPYVGYFGRFWYIAQICSDVYVLTFCFCKLMRLGLAATTHGLCPRPSFQFFSRNRYQDVKSGANKIRIESDVKAESWHDSSVVEIRFFSGWNKSTF